MTRMEDYDPSFYAEGRKHALRSARRVVPWVVDALRPETVVDVGCGVGTWLSVFSQHGVGAVFGVDGAHVDVSALDIARGDFAPRDLSEDIALDRRFDLAMSVEVAEHLPASRAASFVAELCALAPVVLFSAAVPGQGGVHHVNEQWPTYWAAHFAREGFACVDAIRPRFRGDAEVSWWYQQNLFLFADAETLSATPPLAADAVAEPEAWVHPTLVERNVHRMRLQNALLEILAHVPSGGRVLVVDDAQLFDRGPALARDFEWLPFVQRDGKPWGAPASDEEALAELRARVRGGRQHDRHHLRFVLVLLPVRGIHPVHQGSTVPARVGRLCAVRHPRAPPRTMRIREVFSLAWARFKASWTGESRRSLDVRLIDDGIQILESRVGQDERVLRVSSWASVSEIYAYKMDLLTTDCVVVALLTDGDDVPLCFSEHEPSFHAAAKAMERHLPDCRSFDDWWPEVVESPFAENTTRIYVRALEEKSGRLGRGSGVGFAGDDSQHQ